MLRVILATILFWILHTATLDEKIKDKKDYFRLARCAFFGVAVNQLMFFKGLSLTTSINASLIMTTNPIIVFIASYFILHEQITFRKIIGVIMGLTGAALLLWKDEVSMDSDSFLGNLFVLINAISYAIYLVLVKPLMHKYDAKTVVKWIFLFGAVMVIPFGWEEIQVVDWDSFTGMAWFSIAFVIIGTTFIAYLLNAWALGHVTSSVVGIYIYLQPVFASIIAIIMGKGHLDLKTILLSGLIFSGVYLVSKR